MKQCIYLLSIFFSLGFAHGQSNMVPNGNFEAGNNNIPRCDYRSADDFNHDIFNCQAENTPDWKYERCGNINSVGCSNPAPNKYVGLYASPGAYEAVFVKLTSTLAQGKSYILKLKARTGSVGPAFNAECRNMDNGETTGSYNIADFAPPLVPDNRTTCKWYSYSAIFTLDQDYEWLYIKKILDETNGSYAFIDDVEITEYCPATMYRQAIDYNVVSELEEAGNILAGSKVLPTYTLGDVNVKSGAKATFKGYNEVSMREGFNVERGADFIAKIAPCGKECPSTDLPLTTAYTLCNTGCIKLGVDPLRGLSYSWTATDGSILAYLSALNISNPMFCPPTGKLGPFTYTLVTTNTCGETTSKTVTIFYDASSNPTPSFSILNSNIDAKPDQPALTIKPVPHTEKVVVDITDCNGTVLQSTVYTNGVNFDNLGQIDWSSSQFFDPCGCYKIVVKSKNYCYDNWKTETYAWNRNTSLSNVDAANVTICKDGKPYLCFVGDGIDVIKIQMKKPLAANGVG